MAGEAREKCAVAGVLTTETGLEAAPLVYENLFAMQHRGAEASGIASFPVEGTVVSHREQGMVHDVYGEKEFQKLAGQIAVGHNRYSTSGAKDRHPQPYKDAPTGFGLSLNGNVPDLSRLEAHLETRNIQHQSMNDAEMMGHSIALSIRDGLDLPSAIQGSYELFEGAFSCVASHDNMLVAFRDPKGIRPLAIGSFEGGYAITSETCGLDIIDAKYEREVEPGELVIITSHGIESQQLAATDRKLDMFEFVYFARHDSQIYGQRVNEVRRRMGEKLAEEHPLNDNKDAIVIPVPDTSVPAAEGYAETLGLRHRQSIIKNRYIGRTFMQPNQKARRQQLRRKHNIIPEAVKGQDIILIDDSIVRLNTMPRLVELAYLSGAKSVSVLIHSPPVRFPDFYGIDTPSQDELAAANMTVEQIKHKINSTYLGYLSLGGMVEATNMPLNMFNLSCFTGEYPIDIGARRKEITTPVSMEYVE